MTAFSLRSAVQKFSISVRLQGTARDACARLASQATGLKAVRWPPVVERGREEGGERAQKGLQKIFKYIHQNGSTNNKQQMAGWPNGKASDYESGDCGFEPHVGQYFFFCRLQAAPFFFSPLRVRVAMTVGVWPGPTSPRRLCHLSSFFATTWTQEIAQPLLLFVGLEGGAIHDPRWPSPPRSTLRHPRPHPRRRHAEVYRSQPRRIGAVSHSA